MPKNSHVKCLLTAALYVIAVCIALHAIALRIAPSASAAQTAPPAGGGKIVGRVVERGTNLPLRAEVAVSAHVTRNLLLRNTQASEAGEFVIDGVGPGKIHLVTKIEGYAAEHQSISLGAGETKRVEFALTKVKLVRGVVRGPGGRPIHGATVKVLYGDAPLARGEIRTTYQWETGDTYSDERGNFVIGVHPERPFVVEASHRDLLDEVSAPVHINADAREARVNLTLQSGIKVAGEVKDASGKAVPGAQVRLMEVGSRRSVPGFTSHNLLGQQMRFTASGADGGFGFEQVGPSRKMLVVVHPGYKPFRQMVELSPSKSSSAPLRVVLTANK